MRWQRGKVYYPTSARTGNKWGVIFATDKRVGLVVLNEKSSVYGQVSWYKHNSFAEHPCRSPTDEEREIMVRAIIAEAAK